MAHTITEQQQHEHMLKTPIPKLITSLAGPTVLSQLISVIYNTADTWFVSQISTSASAAVGVVFSLMSIIHAFGFGIGMGCGSLISRRLGQKKNDEAFMYAASGFAAAFTVGAVVGILGLCFTQPLMRLLGSTETMLPHSSAYARYILIGAPIMCSSFVLNNVLRAQGAAKLAMWGLCAGGIINIGLDPLLIFVFKMGIGGAALATVISQCVSFCILLSHFLRGRSIVPLDLKRISRRFEDYKMIILTGIPTIFRQGLASIASATLNVHAAVYGDAAVAAVTIANKVYMLVRNIVIGIGQGFQPVAGYNYGAGDKKRTKAAFRFTCALGTAICLIAAIFTAVFSSSIVGWFRNDPEVIRIGSRALLFASAVTPLMAYSTYVNQLYQSLGFKLPATILASCRQGIFFLPLIYILPSVLGLTGVQMAQPGADLLTFLISVPFQIYFFKRILNENE